MTTHAHRAHDRHEPEGDGMAEQVTTINEWGIEWAEKLDRLPDVSGPYLTAQEAREGLESSAFDGRVVWRTTTITAWRDWKTTTSPAAADPRATAREDGGES